MIGKRQSAERLFQVQRKTMVDIGVPALTPGVVKNQPLLRDDVLIGVDIPECSDATA
jgi:hypothetical protein